MPHIHFNQSNQKGFSAVEGLLVTIIVILVVFVSYYVWHTQKETNKTLNAATSTAQASPPKQAPIAKFTPTQAVNFVQTTYDAYLAAITQGNAQNSANQSSSNQSLQAIGLAAVKQDLSPAFEKQIGPAVAGKDDVGCALYAVDKYTASLTNSNTTKADVAVAIISGGSTNGTINVSVDLGTHKINNIVCP
jgi:hypothetical protein